MRQGILRTLLLLIFLTGGFILLGQEPKVPLRQQMPEVSDTTVAAGPAADTLLPEAVLPRLVKAIPLPAIGGPQDIHLDQASSLKFLERLCASSSLWKKSDDPLREALRNLVWLASKPPADTLYRYLTSYPYENLKVPADSYFRFDTVRIVLPAVVPDSMVSDSAAIVVRETAGEELYIKTTAGFEKVKITPEKGYFTGNDTVRLNDSVFILKSDFIPVRLPHSVSDTIMLVITDTLHNGNGYRTPGTYPFRYTADPFGSDSLQAAITSLMSYLEKRDSTMVHITSEGDRGTSMWLNSMSGSLVRFWLPDSGGDSITVWVGSPRRNTISVRTDDGVYFRKQTWRQEYADTRFNVISAREEELRKVALSKIKPQLWNFKTNMSYLLSQGIISNWAKGGESNISTVADITSTLTYNNRETKGTSVTTGRFALGLQASGREGKIRKNQDILEINSKLNHSAFGKFDLSGLFQFKTQFLPGYNYPNDSVKVSKFFNPASIIFGYGLEYKPEKNTSISFSPLSYKSTFVPDTANINQTKYGIPADRWSKNELGAYLTVTSKVTLFEKVTMSNRLQLFSNFIEKPQNIDIDWEMIATIGLNWFTDLRINIHLIYDDDTLLPRFHKGEPVLGQDGIQKKAPMVQFNELLGVSFVFKF